MSYKKKEYTCRHVGKRVCSGSPAHQGVLPPLFGVETYFPPEEKIF